MLIRRTRLYLHNVIFGVLKALVGMTITSGDKQLFIPLVRKWFLQIILVVNNAIASYIGTERTRRQGSPHTMPPRKTAVMYVPRSIRMKTIIKRLSVPPVNESQDPEDLDSFVDPLYPKRSEKFDEPLGPKKPRKRRVPKNPDDKGKH